MTTTEFLGTYPVRNIGKAEQGIHMPVGVTGVFSLYRDPKTKDILLKWQGEKP